MHPVYFHIDVNSAYLSWTSLERLQAGDTIDLREIPSIIGGDMEKRHGVVLAKSIPAKKFGIQTGEPVVNAFRKCPSLVSAPPDHDMYARYSHMLMDFLATVCPDLEQVSIDECYMDFTPIAFRYASFLEAAASIKDTIRDRFGFTVNIGISDRKVLAKMASDFEKPDRIHTLFHTEIQKKIWPLPVSSLFMCGKSSQETLRKLEILTIGDLAKADVDILQAHLKSHGKLLWEYANGIDTSVIISNPVEAKGIGNSITLAKDVVTYEEAATALLNLSESVGTRLRESGQTAGMVSTEIKYADFKVVSHQTTLHTPTDSSSLIYQTACRLFLEIWNHAPVRLLGVRTSKLCPKSQPMQLSLFDLDTLPEDGKTKNHPEEGQKPAISREKQKSLDSAIDQIREKFGSNAVIRGSLLHRNDDYKKH